jgi:hypothetical protein
MKIRISICFLSVLFLLVCSRCKQESGNITTQDKTQVDSLLSLQLNAATASGFARLALNCVQKEYPNKPDHVMNNAGEIQSPATMHPAFYGCFDWHSCVHGHWMLVRLLKQFPGLPEEAKIRTVINQNLTAKNILTEVAYLDQGNRASFERTYGWAWLLKLAEELYTWDDPDGKAWSANLAPLTQAIVERYLDFLPKQTYPIRTGVHPNTAFAIAFALDYARTTGNTKLESMLVERSMAYYEKDRDYPAAWEPGGEDFFSPALTEADLMRRVLDSKSYPEWVHAFLPKLGKGTIPSLLNPAVVTDRTDPKIVHLDGLNLSRAWCMKSIAEALPAVDSYRPILYTAAYRHAMDALGHVASGNYEGEHWLATFAVYLLTNDTTIEKK